MICDITKKGSTKNVYICFYFDGVNFEFSIQFYFGPSICLLGPWFYVLVTEVNFVIILLNA